MVIFFMIYDEHYMKDDLHYLQFVILYYKVISYHTLFLFIFFFVSYSE